MKVRCSPDGAEQTVIAHDLLKGTLRVGVGRSSLDPEVVYWFRAVMGFEMSPQAELTEPRVEAQEAPFALAPGERLNLHIFLDRSVLEVFANGRQCLLQRIYPSRSDSLDVRVFSRGGGMTVRSIAAWDMAATNG